MLQLRKTLTQFWKDYNTYNCIKNLAWAWGDVTKEGVMTSGRRHKRFIHDLEGLAKDKEDAKVNKAVVEMTNDFKLGTD